jgi:hypothetical protein
MAMTNAERQRKYKEKAEATGLTRLQVWVTPTQQEAIRRMLAGEDGPTVRDNELAVRDNVTSNMRGSEQTSLIEDLKRIVETWEEKLKPHQDANGQVKQPRWAKCWELWQELARVINSSSINQDPSESIKEAP